MSTEIERKFLISPGAWRPDPARGIRIRQGYLSRDPARVVRVRVAGRKGFLTIKGLTRGLSRVEFEYPIPVADADQMLNLLADGPLIEKRRHRVRHQGRTWEIDVFEGANAPLVLAEVELPDAGASVDLPPWVGSEVSDDPRYFNSNLATHPYGVWGAS